jgi:hypothetical protein
LRTILERAFERKMVRKSGPYEDLAVGEHDPCPGPPTLTLPRKGGGDQRGPSALSTLPLKGGDDQANFVAPGRGTGRVGASPQANSRGTSSVVEFIAWSQVIDSPV